MLWALETANNLICWCLSNADWSCLLRPLSNQGHIEPWSMNWVPCAIDICGSIPWGQEAPGQEAASQEACWREESRGCIEWTSLLICHWCSTWSLYRCQACLTHKARIEHCLQGFRKLCREWILMLPGTLRLWYWSVPYFLVSWVTLDEFWVSDVIACWMSKSWSVR